jgi:squalene-associated FAD-dependent desaturase
VDTGQHIFMGCYHHTLDWFAELGTRDTLWFQDRLEVPYRRRGGSQVVFRASHLPPPLHLLGGLAALEGLTVLEKARLLGLAAAFGRLDKLDGITAARWLDRIGVPRAARELVLEPLAIAALNELPDAVSALPLAITLRELASTGHRGLALGFAVTGLRDTYVQAATDRITAAGGSVRTGTWATRLVVGADGRIAGVKLADGGTLDAPEVVAAIPPWDLAALVDEVAVLKPLGDAAGRFRPSPIVTVHLWLDRRIHAGRLTGLVNGTFHWLFDRTEILGGSSGTEEHLCLVKSGARDLLGKKPDELAKLAEAEVRAFLPEMAGATVLRSRVVWDPNATVSLVPGTDAYRPGPQTAVPGLFVAGDWTRTGLPATIESAVKSGELAARVMLSSRTP